ncbi:hypothetical protein V8C86DRAFT_2448735 [Haematococcus lacustris]
MIVGAAGHINAVLGRFGPGLTIALQSYLNTSSAACGYASPAPDASGTQAELPIHVCCVLERLPVVARPAPDWESQTAAWQRSTHIKEGRVRDYPDVTNILKPGGGSANGTSRLPAAQIASQLQAAASQGIPDWSGSQDRRSMKRHLDQRLYLLVKQQMQGARHPWHFPHSKLQAEETLRAAAERVLVSVMGRQYPVFFIGNAPMAWLPLLPSGGRIFFMLAQVVDDPWGPINLVPDSGALDWAWVTRREATAEYFKDARMAELLGRMLPE